MGLQLKLLSIGVGQGKIMQENEKYWVKKLQRFATEYEYLW
jgi:hypothetical protein